MHVRQILNSKSPEIVSVTPNHTMVEVLRLFRENNIGFVIVALTPGNAWERCRNGTAAMPSPNMAPKHPPCASARS